MRTRLRPSKSTNGAHQTPAAGSGPSVDSIENPPILAVLPKQLTSEARVISVRHPVLGSYTRYLVCPENGFFEFKKVRPSKKASKSLLLVPRQPNGKEEEELSLGKGHANKSQAGSSDTAGMPVKGRNGEDYINTGVALRSPELLVATPLDAIFILLLLLAQENSSSAHMYLDLDGHLDALDHISPHLNEMIRDERLRGVLEKRISSICDIQEVGEENMYRLSEEKLLRELISKSERMASRKFPASLEEKYVKATLEVPVMNVRREDSNISIVSETNTLGDAPRDQSQTLSEKDSNKGSQTSASLSEEASTAATSFSGEPTAAASMLQINPPILDTVHHLQRIKVAFDFLLGSYLAPSLQQKMRNILQSSDDIDFNPLEKHLAHVSSLKEQIQALRSISDNISRKRAHDDDEAAEARAEKKRKKEEEEKKKKLESKAARDLKKVNTSGMKKLSSFFAKKTTAKPVT